MIDLSIAYRPFKHGDLLLQNAAGADERDRLMAYFDDFRSRLSPTVKLLHDGPCCLLDPGAEIVREIHWEYHAAHGQDGCDWRCLY